MNVNSVNKVNVKSKVKNSYISRSVNDEFSLTDDEIVENFQLLTREHNLLKDRMCSECKKSNIRPPFLGISYWYQGGKDYCGSCVGCGWYDGKKWRESINSFVQNKKSDAFK